MKRQTRIVAVAVAMTVLLAGLAVSGCTSPKNASSEPGIEYKRGVLRAVEAVPMDRIWRASRAALNVLDITELDAQGSALAGYIDGRTPDLKKVSVKMRPLTGNKTELTIQIDTFGNEELARLIYDKIQIAMAP